MDAGRFDALSRSVASADARRYRGVRFLGAAGLLAALASAANRRPRPGLARSEERTCALTLDAHVEVGPSAGLAVAGDLTLLISADGAIDEGTLQSDDGETYEVVGQTSGRRLRLRVDLGNRGTLVLIGMGQRDAIRCRGRFAGHLGGPAEGGLGSWSARRSRSRGDSSTAPPAGDSCDLSCPPGQTLDAEACVCRCPTDQALCDGACVNFATEPRHCGACGNACLPGEVCTSGRCGACASGVTCDGVCCAPYPGTTARSFACQAGCICFYGCDDVCPGGKPASAFGVPCDQDPGPLCATVCRG